MANSRRSIARTVIVSFWLLLTVSTLFGCATREHVAKPAIAPDIVNCFDTVGHCSGAKPWLLGGTCCCTPSEQVLTDWQKQGHFAGQTVRQVMNLYHEQGIQLASSHRDCNNACKHGPHVVKGGKCMTPPTPGTENYEEVLFGKVYVLRQEAPKEFRQTQCSKDIAYTVLVPEVGQAK